MAPGGISSDYLRRKMEKEGLIEREKNGWRERGATVLLDYATAAAVATLSRAVDWTCSRLPSNR